MKIPAINRYENLFIKKVFTSNNILQSPYWKFTSGDFFQRHLMGKKYFELGMLYKGAKEAVADEHPLRDDIEKISSFNIIPVDTEERIRTTRAIDINPENFSKYILFAHGGGMTITSRRYQRMYKNLSSLAGIYVPEYRGFGSNLPSAGAIDLRTSMTEDIEAGYKELKKRGIKDEDISIMGYCGGCSPAIELAKKYPALKQLILVAPYVSFTYMPAAECFQPYLKANGYKSPDLENISDVEVPTSIIHTEGDRIIPFAAVAELSEKSKNLANFVVIRDNGFHEFNQAKIEVIKKLVD